jgi:hypothetical protein
VSVAAGEHGLLPKVRGLDPGTIVVADGFSCKTQIEQSETGRRGLHLAQVLKMAHEHGAPGPPGAWPERLYYEKRLEASIRTKVLRSAAGLAGAGVIVAGLAAAARGFTVDG